MKLLKDFKVKVALIVLVILLVVLLINKKVMGADMKKVGLLNIKKSKRRIDWLVVHTTASPYGKNFTVKDVDAWHRANGWNGIGYNVLIQLDGKIEMGRDVDRIPAHVSGYNSYSLGVVYVGGLDSAGNAKDTRTAAQKASLLQVLKTWRAQYPTAKIQGHRDFPAVAKACPCFNAKSEYSNI